MATLTADQLDALLEGGPAGLTAPEHVSRPVLPPPGGFKTFLGIPIMEAEGAPQGVWLVRPGALATEPAPFVELRLDQVHVQAIVTLDDLGLSPEQEASIMRRIQSVIDALARQVIGG